MISKYFNHAIDIIKYCAHYHTINENSLDAFQNKLNGENSSYSKFIILTHARSGSSMLVRSLRNHPNIIGFGELFTPKRVAFNNESFDNFSTRMRAIRTKYPVSFLQNYIFTPYSNNTHAVGFKLFPAQIYNKTYKPLTDWLQQTQDIKIINLYRDNLLASYASLLVARKDGKYGISNQAERSQTTISIDQKKCLQYFKTRKQHEEVTNFIFKKHKMYDIAYEDFVDNPSHHFQLIQEFLEVEPIALESQGTRQEVRPLSEVIVNYDEIHNLINKSEFNYINKYLP